MPQNIRERTGPPSIEKAVKKFKKNGTIIVPKVVKDLRGGRRVLFMKWRLQSRYQSSKQEPYTRSTLIYWTGCPLRSPGPYIALNRPKRGQASSTWPTRWPQKDAIFTSSSSLFHIKQTLYLLYPFAFFLKYISSLSFLKETSSPQEKEMPADNVESRDEETKESSQASSEPSGQVSDSKVQEDSSKVRTAAFRLIS